MPLHDQAQFVKTGVREAGGTPFEFTSASVTDGIANGHRGMKASLVSRELVAESIELVVRGIATTRSWASPAATRPCRA